LGLIYSLIYRYHIQRKVQEIFGQPTSSKSVNTHATTALLSWINWQIQKRFPDMKKIGNLNCDWNDGIALCALIESIKGGECRELPNFDKVRNCKEGLDWGSEPPFRIPKIISAEHLSDPDIDKASVMIYLCYYLQHCFEKSSDEAYVEQVPPDITKYLDDVGLVAIPKSLIVNVKIPTDAKKCSADLDFLKQSVFVVGQTIVFTVDCSFAGEKGQLEITAYTTDTNEQIKTDFRNSRLNKMAFDCFLKAETVGTHELNIRWGEKGNYEHINDSPLKFTVCDPKVVMFDNVQTRHNVYVGDTIEFVVDVSKAGGTALLNSEFSNKKMSCKTIRSDRKVTFIYTAHETHKGSSELSVYYSGMKIKIIEITVASDYRKENAKIETQVAVFTNYINYILTIEEVSNLQWDFQSGVTLAFLLKSLSGNEIGNLNAEPKNKLEMVQNLTLCFSFMKSLKFELYDISKLLA